MQNISLRYTKWINTTQNRTGHVFQGRYKALLIDAESYLLKLVRYIHLNPVRAGAASIATEWPWTGHRAYSGNETIPWLTTDWVLRILSSNELTARKAYVSFVNDGVSEKRREEFHRGTCEGRFLGDDCFVSLTLDRINEKRSQTTIENVLNAVCAVYKIPLETLSSPGKARPFTEVRAIASLIIQEIPHLSMTQLGKELNRDVATLGRAGGRLDNETARDDRLRKLVEKVRMQLDE